MVDGLEREVAAWRCACATSEGALGAELARLEERGSIAKEVAEPMLAAAGHAREELQTERAKGGRLEAELLAAKVRPSSRSLCRPRHISADLDSPPAHLLPPELPL